MSILVPVKKILPNPWQTRIAEPGAEYIKELALDIAKNGLLQVPIGRLHNGDWAVPKDSFADDVLEKRIQGENQLVVQLAFGHNRLAAYRWLEDMKDSSNLEVNWSSMPVEIRDLTDEQMANLAWSENEKRRDVTPIERARAIQKRLDDFGWTNRQAAEELGIDHSTISNILRLLKLPEALQQALQNGEITERAATAILVLFELPEFREGYYSKSRIIQDALNGASSDALRKSVDSYLTYSGKQLEKADFKISQLIPEAGNVYNGLCSACDKRMASRNLCFLDTCFEAKTDFVHQEYLKKASFSSGYGILDPHKAAPSTGLFGAALAEIKKTKCPNLVLEYGKPNDEEQQVKGFPQVRLVCEKRNLSCSCIAGLRANQVKVTSSPKVDAQVETEEIPEVEPAQEAPAPEPLVLVMSAGDLEEAARQARRAKKDAIEKREEIRGLVVERLIEGLRSDQVGVFCLIANRYAYEYQLKDLETYYRMIAGELSRYILPGEADSVEKLLEIINHKLESLQIEAVKIDKTLVEVIEAEDVCAQTVSL